MVPLVFPCPNNSDAIGSYVADFRIESLGKFIFLYENCRLFKTEEWYWCRLSHVQHTQNVEIKQNPQGVLLCLLFNYENIRIHPVVTKLRKSVKASLQWSTLYVISILLNTQNHNAGSVSNESVCIKVHILLWQNVFYLLYPPQRS